MIYLVFAVQQPPHIIQTIHHLVKIPLIYNKWPQHFYHSNNINLSPVTLTVNLNQPKLHALVMSLTRFARWPLWQVLNCQESLTRSYPEEVLRKWVKLILPLIYLWIKPPISKIKFINQFLVWIRKAIGQRRKLPIKRFNQISLVPKFRHQVYLQPVLQPWLRVHQLLLNPSNSLPLERSVKIKAWSDECDEEIKMKSFGFTFFWGRG